MHQNQKLLNLVWTTKTYCYCLPAFPPLKTNLLCFSTNNRPETILPLDLWAPRHHPSFPTVLVRSNTSHHWWSMPTLALFSFWWWSCLSGHHPDAF